MPTKHEAILKRRDVYEIDPRGIEVAKGWNPRTDFSGEEELRDSIIENGVVEPLTVRMDDNRIILVDGERRLRATLRAIAEGHEIKSVPAIIARRSISDPEAMILAILKNDGKPLTAAEEAEAFRRLAAWGMNQKDIARRIGRSQPYVSGRLALIDAAPEVREALARKEIKVNAANRIVAKAGGSVERQREELKKTRESNGDGFKTMTRPKIEKLIAEYRGVKTDKMNERAVGFNEGVIAGLSMVFFNSPEINPEWTKLN
jgi:ParB family chromosome partitioning protein